MSLKPNDVNYKVYSGENLTIYLLISQFEKGFYSELSKMTLAAKVQVSQTVSEKKHMVQNFPKHEVNIGQCVSSDKLAALHVSIQLFQLWLQCIFTVALALVERRSKVRSCYKKAH